MQTLTDFIAYFRLLADQHTEIKSFVHGASERILSQSRSELEYPCLWLETPSLRLSDNGSDIHGWRECAFVVFVNAPGGDYAIQDAAWHRTESLALDIISRLRRDSRRLGFKADLNSVAMDPIHTLFIDDDYGWRVEFRTDTSVAVCYDPAKWLLPAIAPVTP